MNEKITPDFGEKNYLDDRMVLIAYLRGPTKISISSLNKERVLKEGDIKLLGEFNKRTGDLQICKAVKLLTPEEIVEMQRILEKINPLDQDSRKITGILNLLTDSKFGEFQQNLKKLICSSDLTEIQCKALEYLSARSVVIQYLNSASKFNGEEYYSPVSVILSPKKNPINYKTNLSTLKSAVSYF